MLQVSLKLPRKKAVVCQVTIQEMVNNDLVQVSHPQSVQDLPILPRILYLSPSNSPRSLANLAAGQPLPSKISGVQGILGQTTVQLNTTGGWFNSCWGLHPWRYLRQVQRILWGLWTMASCFLVCLRLFFCPDGMNMYEHNRNLWVHFFPRASAWPNTLFLGQTNRCQNVSWRNIPTVKQIIVLSETFQLSTI